MAVVKLCVNSNMSKIALVNLVESREGSRGLRYVATRIYDATTDTTVDTVLGSKGLSKSVPIGELHYAAWQELPMLDIRTKQLVGKNKDKYCTIISARIYELDASEKAIAEKECQVACPKCRGECGDAAYVRISASVYILGYTFMDVNGDKRYMTVAQLRKDDIFQHTHSVGAFHSRCVRKRRVSIGTRVTQEYMPLLEIDDTDTTLEDEDVEQIKALKILLGGWHTMDTDGTLRVDREEILKQQLEELEIAAGVLRILRRAFWQLDTVKRIKLPESVRVIASFAFSVMPKLEYVNIPSQVKELRGNLFARCPNLKCVDFSAVERFDSFAGTFKHLILPDIMQKNSKPRYSSIGILEFRNTTNAKRRVLKALEGGSVDCNWDVERIETNGPVVLGNYGACIQCDDVSALEPNIIGIEPDCSFRKRNLLPWKFGPATRFVYTANIGDYEFTEEAHAADTLRAVTVSKSLNTSLPKSVAILQGELGDFMCGVVYPNVVYASCGLYRRCTDKASLAAKLPALRWVLPRGRALTEVQIKRLEKKLTATLPEVCRQLQKFFAADLTIPENYVSFREHLLTADSLSIGLCQLFDKYGMIYVGDYGAVLGNVA